MPAHLILWPVLVYVGGALLIPRLRPWLNRPGRAFGVLFSSVLAFIFALVIVQVSGDTPLSWTLSAWDQLGGLGEGLRFRADPLGGAFLLLSCLVGMGAMVGSLDEPEEVATEDYQAGLLALLGGVAAFALADNVLTLLVAGLLIDTGILFGVGLTGRSRWLLVIITQSMLVHGFTLMGVLLLWQGTGTTDLAAAGRPVLLVLAIAAVVRMAPLPFSLLPIAYEPLPQRVLALLPLATLGVGSVMLGKIAIATDMTGMVVLEMMVPTAALGIALAGWVAWRSADIPVRLLMLSAIQAAWVFWAFAWGRPVLALATAWTAVLALAALAVHGGRLDFRHGSQLPALIAALMLVGAPGSALWGMTLFLGGEAWARDQQLLLTMALIGTMGNTVALLYWLFPEQGAPVQRSQWAGVTLLSAMSVPFIGALWGLQPPELSAFDAQPAPVAAQLAILVIGWAGGFWLWRVRDLLYPLRPFLDAMSTLFSFVWLWRLLGYAGWQLLRGMRGMMLVLEGENYGWLLLFLFVTMIFLLQG